MSKADAPAQPRDAYGFEVKKEYQKLYKKYAPLWAKEENERTHRWQDFLDTFKADMTASGRLDDEKDAEAALEAALLEHQASGESAEDKPWLQQLKTLVQAGIPMGLRGRLWKIFLQGNKHKEPGVYDGLVSQALAPQYQNSKKLGEPVPFLGRSHLKGNSGKGLDVAESEPPAVANGQQNGSAAPDDEDNATASKSQDWNAQIEKDLHRTFPGHPVMDRSGRRSLRRILSAYACRNSAVGYCQGMNFVAGCLLLFMEEEDAFWCLTVIVERLLPGYFDTTMAASQVDQLVFKQLVEQQFPRLTAHLDELGVNAISVSTQWFLCIFVNSLPLETCLRVWDIFLFHRCSSVLYRVALALVDIYAQALMATVDSIDAFLLLQNMAPLSFDSSRLVDVACIAYSQLDDDYMKQLRTQFQASVDAHVQERLRRTKSQRGRYEGKSRDSISIPEETLTSDPAAVKGAEKDFNFMWSDSKAPLKIASSKAAATAYKIASQPRDSSMTGAETSLAEHDSGISELIGEQNLPSNPEELKEQVKEVLDKRKELDELSVEERESLQRQLSRLVASMEEAVSHANAQTFEAERKGTELSEKVDQMRDEIQAVASRIGSKQDKLQDLIGRKEKEKQRAQAGSKRMTQAATLLQRAQAHQSLKASLLAEKHELIKHLQQETAQDASKSGGRGLMSAFRSLSLRRTRD